MPRQLTGRLIELYQSFFLGLSLNISGQYMINVLSHHARLHQLSGDSSRVQVGQIRLL